MVGGVRVLSGLGLDLGLSTSPKRLHDQKTGRQTRVDIAREFATNKVQYGKLCAHWGNSPFLPFIAGKRPRRALFLVYTGTYTLLCGILSIFIP